MPSEGNRKAADPRLVTVRRPGVEVGVTLCGGNLRGVYIESLDEDSPARGPDGLLPGDLILEVWTHVFLLLLKYTCIDTQAVVQEFHNACMKTWKKASATDRYTTQTMMIYVGFCLAYLQILST